MSALFALCFEAHRPDGLVWAVKYPYGEIDDDQDWQFAGCVDLRVSALSTVYRGTGPVQPRAYLVGLCDRVERVTPNTLSIS